MEADGRPVRCAASEERPGAGIRFLGRIALALEQATERGHYSDPDRSLPSSVSATVFHRMVLAALGDIDAAADERLVGARALPPIPSRTSNVVRPHSHVANARTDGGVTAWSIPGRPPAGKVEGTPRENSNRIVRSSTTTSPSGCFVGAVQDCANHAKGEGVGFKERQSQRRTFYATSILGDRSRETLLDRVMAGTGDVGDPPSSDASTRPARSSARTAAAPGRMTWRGRPPYYLQAAARARGAHPTLGLLVFSKRVEDTARHQLRPGRPAASFPRRALHSGERTHGASYQRQELLLGNSRGFPSDV